MSDGTGLAEQLLGLDGFKVLDVTEGENELVIAIETPASVTTSTAIMGQSSCRPCGSSRRC